MSKTALKSELNQQTSASKIIAAFVRLAIGIDDRQSFLDFLSAETINPKVFLQELQNHKCNEIVLHTIRLHRLKHVLPRLTKQIETKVNRKKIHSEGLWNEFSIVSKLFADQNIPYVLYKGKAFAHQFYPSVTLRHSVDVDLGMALKDIPNAAAILKAVGYEEHKGKIDYDNISQSRAYHIDFSYVKRDTQGKVLYNIELHWTTAHHVLGIQYAFDELLRNRQQLALGKDLVYTLPKIEQAVIIIIHHGMVDVWGKIRHLLDLHYILQSFDEEDMSLFSSKLKQLKLYRSFQEGVQLLEILKNNQETNQLWMHILSGNMSKNWSEFPKKLWWHLRLRESNSERMRVLYKLILFRLKYGNTVL